MVGGVHLLIICIRQLLPRRTTLRYTRQHRRGHHYFGVSNNFIYVNQYLMVCWIVGLLDCLLHCREHLSVLVNSQEYLTKTTTPMIRCRGDGLECCKSRARVPLRNNFHSLCARALLCAYHQNELLHSRMETLRASNIAP